VAILSTRLPGSEGSMTAIGSIGASNPKLRMIALAERGAAHCLVLNPPHLPSRQSSSPAASMCTDCLRIAVSEGALGALRRDAGAGGVVPRGPSRGPRQRLVRAPHCVRDFDGGGRGERRTDPLRSRAGGCRAHFRRPLEQGDRISHLASSEPTVKKHVGHILAKLELQDRLQIGIYVVRNPLLLDRKKHRS
jgi:hypothetical protein